MKKVCIAVVLLLLIALSKACNLELNPHSITLSRHELSLKVGETAHMNATIVPSITTKQTIEWLSTVSNVASVDQSGTISAIMDGQTCIVASVQPANLSDTCLVTVSSTSATVQGDIPSTFSLPQTSSIIATFDRIIVKLESTGNSEYIVISDNLGSSWHKPIKNIIGNIVHTHIFSNGAILFSTNTSCYTTKDYETLEQSTVLDIDGSPYNEPTRKGFYSQMYHDRFFFHDGREMEVFGEYLLEDTSLPRNELSARIWYSTDYGRTIKCAFRSGTTRIDGREIFVRHIHNVGYCDKNKRFYVSTGDNNAESFFLEGTYDAGQDAWSFSIIGNGVLYKFGYFWFDDSFAYLLTDYTSKAYLDKKGILKCPIDSLSNYRAYKNIYNCPEEEWGEIAIVNVVEYPNGVKVLFPDYLGLGVIWVATNDYMFKKVYLDRNILMGYNTMGPNLNNEVYVLSRESVPIHNFNKATKYNLNVLLKENGIVL